MIRKIMLCMVVWTMLCMVFVLPVKGADAVRSIVGSGTTQGENLGKLPLYFVPNRGQVDARARFYAQTPGYTLWMTHNSLVFDSPVNGKRDVSRLNFIGANPRPEIAPMGETAHKTHIYKGADPAKWQKNIPTSTAVLYKNVYKNIDLKLYGVEKQVEYDWIVKPGADPGDIRFKYSGSGTTRLEQNGDVTVRMNSTRLTHRKPIGYQVIKGKKVTVDSSFRDVGDNTYAIKLDSGYDKNYELVIDPVVAITYSSYLGGSGEENRSIGRGDIAVDCDGYIYVTGYTNSSDFPVIPNPPLPCQYSHAGDDDIFLVKMTPDGSSLVFSSLIGGSSMDRSYDIVLKAGDSFLSGGTRSTDFPNYTLIAKFDAILVKFDENGCMEFVVGAGGSEVDLACGAAVDASNNVYVIGYTKGAGFPTTPGVIQPVHGGGTYDAFVFKTDGVSILSCTFLGGAGFESGEEIATDNSYLYITGYTEGQGFPFVNPIFPGCTYGGKDGFVAKISTDLSNIVYSTCIGGSGTDISRSLALDAQENVYIAGVTSSIDFPVKNAVQDTHGGMDDAFVSKINSAGTDLVYSTYLGGSGDDLAWRLVLDNSGAVYVTGETASTDFPTRYAFQSAKAGGGDLFVTKFDPNGTHHVFSTYLGGTGDEYRGGIAVGCSTNPDVYVTGMTQSTDFPVHNPYQGALNGISDAFVTRYSFSDAAPVLWVDKTGMNFSITSSGLTTSPQEFIIRNIGGGGLDWTVSENSNWITCSASSGRNFGVVEVSLTNVSTIPVGTHAVSITVSAPGATDSPKIINVTIRRYDTGSPAGLPFGDFETPVNNAVVMGSVPFSGWALDDIEVTGLQLEFEKNGSVVYTDDVVFVDGLRPEIAQTYANYPNHTRAGWGYLLQSYLLGNGTYTVRAKAEDKEGNQVVLGSKTLHLSISVNPFGAICVPSLTETASGSLYTVEGWVLTPQPNTIDTVSVYIDGVLKGQAGYGESCDNCGNIGNEFPGYADSSAPCFDFKFNTIGYSNGMHTVHCYVEDNQDQSANLGSNYLYFDIRNIGSINALNSRSHHAAPIQNHYGLSELSGILLDTTPIRLQKGYKNNNEFQLLLPDIHGHVNISIKELERIVIHLNYTDRGPHGWRELPGKGKHDGGEPQEFDSGKKLSNVSGYLVVGEQLWPLPLGSTLDGRRGIFYWQTEAGHLGNYRLLFVRQDANGSTLKKIIDVCVAPRF